MKCFLYALSLALILIAAPAFAANVNIKVNGLVCDFCAQSIKKTFGKQEAVNDVQVNLDDGLINVSLKDGQDMDDATITKLITDSGYTVTSIERIK
jgi:copper chaperone CopZ